MFQRAFLERAGDGKRRLEERLVADVLTARGMVIEWYTQKQIDRRALPLGEDTFIMGAMPAMHGAMKQLDIPIPPPNDYPPCLQPFFCRAIWRSTLDQFERRVWGGLERPVFVKPAERRKAFTGRVFTSPDDLWFLGNTTRRQEIWCSDAVRWESEYRVYVIDGQVVAIDHYAGRADVPLSEQTLTEAVDTYCKSGSAPAAFGIDFGVLDTGETALVEANDGFSLGAYQVEGAIYTNVLLTRWSELLTMRNSGADVSKGV
ncbi:MAG: ATP-grasp domain-containing protein [Polyangiaceae bacterium]|nr:ATP-grasp domain-containing protein [Polyangiaceae bacterium]